MTPVTRIHHINFVVRDLEAAISRYEQELGLPAFSVSEHAPRGSRIARTKIGDTWLVLVCPQDADSAPGAYLAQHGEGFFMLSFGVDDLEERLKRISEHDRGNIRDGILDWKVANIGDWFGAELQLTQD